MYHIDRKKLLPIGTRVYADEDGNAFFYKGDKGTIVDYEKGAQGVWIQFDIPRHGDGRWYCCRYTKVRKCNS